MATQNFLTNSERSKAFGVVSNIEYDPIESLQAQLNRCLDTCAAHVAAVITYPGGQQIVLKGELA